MKKLLTIEQGQIGFFYRSKIDVRCPKTRSDIQRFYLLLLPDKAAKGRLLVVGKKRLPQIIKGKSKSTEREWSLVSAVAKPERLGDLLRPEKYRTDTKGERTVGEAIPAGEGRYAIFIKEDDDSSMLVYELKSPKIPGHAQKE
ncbi:MAG: hypothetical protein KDD70_18190, partial [Bdellovibrionales bacterium]|nr:hypothetical protein [Bdellovibrionales bacterium]